MAIPESIRKVLRPVNTVVQDTGREGSKRYIVRERKSIKYISNQNPQPVNGKTIGYILDTIMQVFNDMSNRLLGLYSFLWLKTYFFKYCEIFLFYVSQYPEITPLFHFHCPGF